MARRKAGMLASIQRRIRLQRFRRLLIWGGTLFALYALVGGPHGFIRYQQLKNQYAGFEIDSRRMTAEMLDLEQEIKRLTEDTLYIEKVARERHGYARPGERVYKITKR